MEMALSVEAFEELNFGELLEVDGGVNWDRVYQGTTVYLAATMAFAGMTGPIGWGVVASYWAICAASGAYVGYGLAS